MPETVGMPYHVPSIVAPVMDSRGRRHYQYNTIVLVKVQLAEQCKMAKKIAKTWPLKLYEVPSSQGTTLSPGGCLGKKRDFGGSHCLMGHASSRVSEENEMEESYNSDEC